MQIIKKPFGRLALLALALSPITALLAGVPYQFEPVRVPENFGTPVAIDNSGTILLEGLDADPAVVKDGSAKPFSIPNAASPSPAALNSQGTIVGTASTLDLTDSFGFVLPKHGKMTTLNIPGGSSTTPMGINDCGVVVGSVFGDDGIGKGFIWDSRGPRLFTVPGMDYTELAGINDAGTIVGNYYFYGEPGPDFGMFTLEGSKYTPLKVPGIMWPIARGINSRGDIVGSYFENFFIIRGFIYSRGVLTPVDYPFTAADAPPPQPFDMGDGRTGTLTYVASGGYTSVTGINDRGDIVGQAGMGYTPTVECDACGLTGDDFPGEFVTLSFTGESDGHGCGQVKPHGKLQRVSVPHGMSAADFLHGRNCHGN